MGIVQTICDKLYLLLSAGSVLIFFILYKLITKTLWVKEIKTHLVECINLLGSEFKKTLISDPEAKFNSYLLQYLETGDKKFLAEAASYLKDKQSPSRWKPYTEPSIVMIALIKQIVREQLKEEYTKGFVFDSDKFEKLEKIAPFVHAYCVKIKFNGRDKYHTDFLRARPGDSMNDIICHSIEEVKSKVGEKENPAVEIMSLPSKVICIVKNGYGATKYKFTSFQASDLIVSSYFTKYVITGLLLRSQGWFFRTYEAVGGDEFSPEDIKLIEKKFNEHISGFLSVIVAKTYAVNQ